MKVTRMGVDLAKQVFQVHGVNRHGNVVIRKQLTRGEMRGFFAQLPACLIGMEACASAHYWARELSQFGHTVRLIAPQFVRPSRKHLKNDGNDAEAICEAVSRPNMRFVPVKSVAQQAVLTVHRARELLVGNRTALANQMRGLWRNKESWSRKVLRASGVCCPLHWKMRRMGDQSSPGK
jgi:transposase